MKKILRISILMAYLTFSVFHCFSQSVDEPKITAPFELLRLSDVNASGNIKTGAVEITMIFKNDYNKVSDVSLALGGFPDFGITDSKGRKYKVFTDVNAVNDNKGYLNIPFVQFGDKKFNWVATVAQQIPPSESRKLTVRLNKMDQGIPIITEFHIRCILALDYGHVGDKTYTVENIKINWK